MHYADGTEAKVGDLVKGTCYNTKNADGSLRVIVGTMLQIAPGSDTCNCVVGFVEEEPATLQAYERQHSGGAPLLKRLSVDQPGEAYGSVQREVFLFARADFSECKAFTLVHRPAT